MEEKNDNCFYNTEVKFGVALPPSSVSNAMETINQQLYHLLYQYNDRLKGIPIVFSNVRFATGEQAARILGEQPWLHIDLITSVIVFKPTIGSFVLGKVIKVS